MTVAAKSTSDPMDVDRFGKGGKKGKKEGKGQHQSQNPNKDVVCCAQNVGRIQRISPAPVELKTKEVKENRRKAQAKAHWNRENELQW